MARITVEDCLAKENNRFALVQLAAKRAKQLLHGAKANLEEDKGNKAVVNALREIAEGKVAFMTAEEMAKAEEEARLEREREEAAQVQQPQEESERDKLFKPRVETEAALDKSDDEDDDDSDDESDDEEEDDDDDSSDDDSDDGEGRNGNGSAGA